MHSHSFLRLAAAAALASLAIGCSSTPNYSPAGSDTQLAAYAAQSRYPDNMQPRSDLPITAVVGKFNGDITLRNFTDKTVHNPRLWVNHTYVIQLHDLAPQGRLVVRSGDLYNSAGLKLSDQPVNSITNLTIQTDDNLIQLQGPQFD